MTFNELYDKAIKMGVDCADWDEDKRPFEDVIYFIYKGVRFDSDGQIDLQCNFTPNQMWKKMKALKKIEELDK